MKKRASKSEKKSGEVKHYTMTPALREKIDDIVRKAAKPNAVEAALDKRYSTKPGVWSAYERFLLSNGHTVFVSLDTMTASVSSKPSAKAVRDVKARERRNAERAERKAKREAKKAERKAKKPELSSTTKKAAKASGVKVLAETGWTPTEEIRINEIMRIRNCNRGSAIRQFKNEKLVKEADLHAAKVAVA